MKYIMPTSMAWWAGFIPIVLGIAMAILPAFPEYVELYYILQRVVGEVPPAVLINGGLAVIGLRSAVKQENTSNANSVVVVEAVAASADAVEDQLREDNPRA